jgi:Caspase domain
VKYEPRYNNSWALIIGIEKYRHVNPLEIARADAESIRDVLVQKFQFPPRNVSVLLDSQATRNRIMARFLSYESLDPDESTLRLLCRAWNNGKWSAWFNWVPNTGRWQSEQ